MDVPGVGWWAPDGGEDPAGRVDDDDLGAGLVGERVDQAAQGRGVALGEWLVGAEREREPVGLQPVAEGPLLGLPVEEAEGQGRARRGRSR